MNVSMNVLFLYKRLLVANFFNLQDPPTTAYLINQIPTPTHFEIALFGRSNVGKSSLINFLFNQKITKKQRAR